MYLVRTVYDAESWDWGAVSCGGVVRRSGIVGWGVVGWGGGELVSNGSRMGWGGMIWGDAGWCGVRWGSEASGGEIGGWIGMSEYDVYNTYFTYYTYYTYCMICMLYIVCILYILSIYLSIYHKDGAFAFLLESLAPSREAAVFIPVFVASQTVFPLEPFQTIAKDYSGHDASCICLQHHAITTVCKTEDNYTIFQQHTLK